MSEPTVGLEGEAGTPVTELPSWHEHPECVHPNGKVLAHGHGHFDQVPEPHTHPLVETFGPAVPLEEPEEPEKPWEILRRAAAKIREVAEAANQPWHGWGDESLPQRQGEESWRADVIGYLGGTWGEHAALWNPWVAEAVAGWLEAEASVMGEMEPFAEVINATITQKTGIESFIRFGRDEDGQPAMHLDTSPSALAVAEMILR